MKAPEKVLFAIGLGGGLVGATILLSLFLRDAGAACNSAQNNKFQVTDLELKAYVDGKQVHSVVRNQLVTFKATFDSSLIIGDSATFACKWSGDVNANVSHAVSQANTLSQTKAFDSAGTKTACFQFSGAPWGDETCSASVSVSIAVAEVGKLEYRIGANRA